MRDTALPIGRAYLGLAETVCFTVYIRCCLHGNLQTYGVYIRFQPTLRISDETGSFERPLILPTDFIFFLWCEVVLDVKHVADFFHRLALDRVRHPLARII